MESTLANIESADANVVFEKQMWDDKHKQLKSVENIFKAISDKLDLEKVTPRFNEMSKEDFGVIVKFTRDYVSEIVKKAFLKKQAFEEFKESKKRKEIEE